jgi:hypothetical protein
MSDEYHGIVLNISQRDKSIFKRLQVLGSKRAMMGMVTFYKIGIDLHQIDEVISKIQANMNSNIGPVRQQFYAHFYRDSEMIIAFKNKAFKVTTDPTTWAEAIRYGKSLNIAEKQLDFTPCKFEDETY